MGTSRFSSSVQLRTTWISRARGSLGCRSPTSNCRSSGVMSYDRSGRRQSLNGVMHEKYRVAERDQRRRANVNGHQAVPVSEYIEQFPAIV